MSEEGRSRLCIENKKVELSVGADCDETVRAWCSRTRCEITGACQVSVSIDLLRHRLEEHASVRKKDIVGKYIIRGR